MDTDLELTEACKKGSRNAFQTLYCRFAPTLRIVLMRYVADTEVAEDLLHDVFYKIIGSKLKAFEYRNEGSLRAWLTRLSANEALMWLRREKRFLRMEENEPIPDIAEEPTPEEVQSLSEKELMSLIEQLPVGYRTVFNLYVFEQMSHKEIGQMLGINEKSSSSQLARAKKLLAAQIKKRMV